MPAGIKALKADNFFQTFGHELLRGRGPTGPSGFSPGVEFHGPLDSTFNNVNLELTGTSTQATIFQISSQLASRFRFDTTAKRIAASNQLHVAAVDDGEVKRDAVVQTLIKP